MLTTRVACAQFIIIPCSICVVNPSIYPVLLEMKKYVFIVQPHMSSEIV